MKITNNRSKYTVRAMLRLVFVLAALVGLGAISPPTDVTQMTGARRASIQLGQLYPTIPNLDALTQYPGAQYLDVSPSSIYSPISFDFETDDAPEAVAGFYRDLIRRLGWQQAGPENNLWPGAEISWPRYYYGDHGQHHVYGYWLMFFAVDHHDASASHLRTFGHLEIARSLPTYLGATNAVESMWDSRYVGGQILKFSTRDTLEEVLAYYRDVLMKDGCTQIVKPRLVGLGDKPEDPVISVYQPEPSGWWFTDSEGYFTVTVDDRTPGDTKVTIESSWRVSF